MLVALHEYRVQRPVKILAGADTGRLHRFERIDHRAGPDRNAGRAQRAGEVEDIFGEPAVRLLTVAAPTVTSPLEGEVARRSRPGGG